MKWRLQSDASPCDAEELIKILLKNRGLTVDEDIKNFLLSPPVDSYNLVGLGVDKKELDKALRRIQRALRDKESIVVYGDYDADGICATAIIWETLRGLGAKALPFIPLREKEGYGLSNEGIDSILEDEKYNAGGGGLIISVDSGIVASGPVEYAKSKHLDTIILDHHEREKTVPKAKAIVHTQKLCASGIAHFLARELGQTEGTLELATIATITDLMPLLGVNRSIVKYGLELLNNTSRPGLRALFSVAGISKVGTYEIGYMVGPRINASGRIENALLALRMLCTPDFSKALEYATALNETNRNRQTMMEEMTLHALEMQSARAKGAEFEEKIIVIDHESYHQGIIGLIAGKLVEQYYLPAIVIARGEKVSRASARSITGFNIIEAIRTQNDLLLGAGGHPMAAGFTIQTEQIELFRKKINQVAVNLITEEMLVKSLRIDCLLDLEIVNFKLYEATAQFAPFGLGNPEPTFVSEATINNLRTVGQEGKHLKLTVNGGGGADFDCIAFGKGEMSARLKQGDKVSLVYTLDLNFYNGRSSLQLKIKDINV